ncbi:hypothetical protein L9F63_003877, partial [Diploptera punctata]
YRNLKQKLYRVERNAVIVIVTKVKRSIIGIYQDAKGRISEHEIPSIVMECKYEGLFKSTLDEKLILGEIRKNSNKIIITRQSHFPYRKKKYETVYVKIKHVAKRTYNLSLGLKLYCIIVLLFTIFVTTILLREKCGHTVFSVQEYSIGYLCKPRITKRVSTEDKLDENNNS